MYRCHLGPLHHTPLLSALNTADWNTCRLLARVYCSSGHCPLQMALRGRRCYCGNKCTGAVMLRRTMPPWHVCTAPLEFCLCPGHRYQGATQSDNLVTFIFSVSDANAPQNVNKEYCG